MSQSKPTEKTDADNSSLNDAVTNTGAPASPPDNKTDQESGEDTSIREKVMREAEEDYQPESDSQERENTIADKEEQNRENAVASADTPPILEASAGIWSNMFNGFARGGPIVLLIALACMAWHDFMQPDNAIYCPAEFKAITGFLHCIAQGSWLTPTGLDSGAWTLAQWPGFFWFTGLMALIPGIGVSSILLPLTEFTAAALAVIAIWCVARACHFGNRAAFAAGVMAIACPIFAPLPHFMGSAALAAAFFLFALLFFYRGWTREHAFISLPLAFIFTALGGLTGGFLHLVVPLVASLCFLIWRGTFKRGQRLDALIGFILMLVIFGVWLGWVMLSKDDPDYLAMLFKESLALSLPLEHLWWAALVAGFFGVLPWLLTIFGVSWFRVLKESGSTLSASRHENGSALIWISLTLAAGCSIWIPQFHTAAVAIACLVILLLAKAFLRMPSAGNCFFFAIAALLTTCVGLLLFAMHYEFSQNWLLSVTHAPVPQLARETLLSLSALPIIAGILVVGGICGFYFAKRNHHAGGLIYALLLAIILCQPGRLLLVPELGANPQLPVRNFAFITGEVEKALAGSEPSAIQQPEATPAIRDEEKVAPEMAGKKVEENAETSGPPSANPEIQLVPAGPDLGRGFSEGTQAEEQDVTPSNAEEKVPTAENQNISNPAKESEPARREAIDEKILPADESSSPAPSQLEQKLRQPGSIPSLEDLRETPRELPDVPEVNLPQAPAETNSGDTVIIKKEIEIIKPEAPAQQLPDAAEKPIQ